MTDISFNLTSKCMKTFYNILFHFQAIYSQDFAVKFCDPSQAFQSNFSN